MPQKYKGGRDAAQKRYREKNREKRNAQKRDHYEKNKKRIREKQSQYRKENLEKLRITNKKWRDYFWSKIRKECIEAYGGKCVCCGEKELHFLELDHIYNDGSAERKKHQNGRQEWLYLKRKGWPKNRHQLLCANCNRGKLRNKGICPHKKKDQF